MERTSRAGSPHRCGQRRRSGWPARSIIIRVDAARLVAIVAMAVLAVAVFASMQHQLLWLAAIGLAAAAVLALAAVWYGPKQFVHRRRPTARPAGIADTACHSPAPILVIGLKLCQQIVLTVQ